MSLPTQTGPLLIGAATLVAGLFVGKLAVDAALPAVEETGSDDFTDSVRLVASLVGLSISLTQLPTAIAEAQAILQQGTLTPK